MQVPMRLREPIEEGRVDLLFRRWKRLQAVVGNTYRTAAGRLTVTAVDVVDPDALTDDDVAEVDRRLDRLDRASSWGAWTMPTLRVIESRPAVVSTVLAEALGRDRPAFKLDVRKLKALGLTESLEVGYRLSPRGRAYLARTTRPG